MTITYFLAVPAIFSPFLFYVIVLPVSVLPQNYGTRPSIELRWGFQTQSEI